MLHFFVFIRDAYFFNAETLLHYQKRIQGYQDVMKWQPTKSLFPLLGQGKGSRNNNQTIGPELLSQFQSPTIFLKISCDCDGDYLLPIIVGIYRVTYVTIFQVLSNVSDGIWLS